ncbi:MAG: tetratricopeptide repeat protein [Phycisphaerae bacterium]|nr:tetratricopeptide repeat protein [Phycisphaerae bacterium]
MRDTKPHPASISRTPIAIAVVLLVLLLGGMLIVVARTAARAAREPRLGVPGVPPGGMNEADMTQTIEDARRLSDGGDFGKASAMLAAVIARRADRQDLRLAYAQSLIGEKRWEDALRQLEAALAIGPDLPAIYFDAGTVANAADKIERSEELYAIAQQKEPTQARHPLYLGMVQIKQGKTGPGTASLVRAVTLDPNLAEAWGTLAEVSLRDNEPRLAIQHAQRARTIQPKAVRWRLVEARALKRLGKPEEAATLLLALEKGARRDSGIMETLAECYGMLSRPHDAAVMYGEAFTDDPRGEWARLAAVWFERDGDAERALSFARLAADCGDPTAAELVRRLETPIMPHDGG